MLLSIQTFVLLVCKIIYETSFLVCRTLQKLNEKTMNIDNSYHFEFLIIFSVPNDKIFSYTVFKSIQILGGKQ